MKTIKITCGNCMESFEFAHPSVRSAKDIMGITLDCGHCGVTLKAPSNELHMKPLGQVIIEDLEQKGIVTRASKLSKPGPKPKYKNSHLRPLI